MTTRDSATAIRAVIDAWTEALRAKDAAGVVVHHAEDFVLFSLAPPLVSQAAGIDGLNAWFGTWEGRLDYQVRDLELVISDDVAFGHCLSRLGGIKRGAGRQELWFRQTLGLRRIGGSWKLAHQHTSVPFYMDGSDRACVDLAP